MGEKSVYFHLLNIMDLVELFVWLVKKLSSTVAFFLVFGLTLSSREKSTF